MRSCLIAGATKEAVLARAVAVVGDRLPTAMAPDGRTRESATYLVAAALEGSIAAGRDGLRTQVSSALGDAARSGLPLLTDDVTRRFEERLSADLVALVEPLLAQCSWQSADGDLLGPLFEGCLGADRRKRLGQYYTPPDLISFLLERALAPFDPLAGAPFRVVDPACGAGNFLAPAAAHLVGAYRSRRADLARLRPGERWDDAAIVTRVFRDHLAGLDIDPWAARVARIRLRLKALDLGGTGADEPRIGHFDALRRGTDAGHEILGERYRAVVGNPPYGADLSPRDRAYVSARYDLGKGRFDTTALFVERGLDLLVAGGRLAFVVPHGVTRTGAYGPCRDLLARESRYVALLDAGLAFPGVNLETVGFVAEKNDSPASGGPRTVELASLRGGSLVALGSQHAGFYRDRPNVPIYVPGEVGRLIAKLEDAGVPLETIARIRRGCPVSARDPALAEPSAAPPEGTRVVRGRDISRYACLDGAALYVLRRESPLHDAYLGSARPGARVGYQNIASGIVATLLPGGTLPLDTVNYLEAPNLPVLALLGYLNSRLAAFYFRLAIANMANLTVHLDTPTLGPLPVVLPDPEAVGDLAGAVFAGRGAAIALAQLDEAASAVDEAVFAQANLTAAERSIVLKHAEPALASLARRRRQRG